MRVMQSRPDQLSPCHGYSPPQIGGSRRIKYSLQYAYSRVQYPNATEPSRALAQWYNCASTKAPKYGSQVHAPRRRIDP
eukprot:2875569-Pyramimonas_sp.AAC.1